ncbi:hypothetical protein ACFE04_001418 [Oxalis oulophora]
MTGNNASSCAASSSSALGIRRQRTRRQRVQETFWTMCPRYTMTGNNNASSSSASSSWALGTRRKRTRRERVPETFLTMCPRCRTRYEYYITCLGSMVVCAVCGENFRGVREAPPRDLPTQ